MDIYKINSDIFNIFQSYSVNFKLFHFSIYVNAEAITHFFLSSVGAGFYPARGRGRAPPLRSFAFIPLHSPPDTGPRRCRWRWRGTGSGSRRCRRR